MVLRIEQINAQRSAAAAANIEMLMQEKGLDILCIQEPFCYKGKVRGCNSPKLTKIQLQNCEKSWVAAEVKKDTVDILVSVGEEYEHIIYFKVITGYSELTIINAYC